MTGTQYLILAYIVSLALLWGYAIILWLNHRSLARRAGASGGTPPGRADRALTDHP